MHVQSMYVNNGKVFLEWDSAIPTASAFKYMKRIRMIKRTQIITHKTTRIRRIYILFPGISSFILYDIMV